MEPLPYASWQQLVRAPSAGPHVLQLYRDSGFLGRAVAAWTAESLRQGGGAVLFGTPANAARVRACLHAEGLDAASLERAGRLMVVDADEAMSGFMVDGFPDETAFHSTARDAFRCVRDACDDSAGIRAWGEMVDILWKRGDTSAAERLESFWNDVIHAEQIRLMCSYEVDNLSPETHEGVLDAVFDAHTQLIPEEDYERLEKSVSRALVDVFGEEEAWTMRRFFEARQSRATGMPSGEAVLMALYAAQPQLGKRVLLATRRHWHGAGEA